jgi:hypothetical protein
MVGVILYFAASHAKRKEGRHLDDKHAFSAITDFESIKYQLPVLVVGDGPDARTCTLSFRSRVCRCFLSWGFIEFENGQRISYAALLHKEIFLFENGAVEELFRRREAEHRVLRWFETASNEDARIIGDILLKAAAHHTSLSLWPAGAVLMVVEMHMLNVGLELLLQVADLVETLKPAAPSSSAA